MAVPSLGSHPDTLSSRRPSDARHRAASGTTTKTCSSDTTWMFLRGGHGVRRAGAASASGADAPVVDLAPRLEAGVRLGEEPCAERGREDVLEGGPEQEGVHERGEVRGQVRQPERACGGARGVLEERVRGVE